MRGTEGLVGGEDEEAVRGAALDSVEAWRDDGRLRLSSVLVLSDW